MVFVRTGLIIAALLLTWAVIRSPMAQTVAAVAGAFLYHGRVGSRMGVKTYRPRRLRLP